MIDPQITAWLDQDDARIAHAIRQHGWSFQYVGGGVCSVPGCPCDEDDGSPPFGYTVGLFGWGHPELLIFGVSPDTAAGVFEELCSRVRAGAQLTPGQLLTFGQWAHRIVVEEVPNPGEIVFAANRFYQRPAEVSVPVLQLTYDDMSGRFPWDPGYADPAMQPRPGTFRA